ncbi:hypothetical protein H696_00075 [Fonticula alba]|uniref:Lysophospholipase n=1 Tax=Fonticula alba TaxID=691883 RepID=A0A058ZDP7_FONAL|nr:hypothetical protein H696_00075 [Fonticula alba]KCV72479.1 hypothetical protein H696_00075 [Fonticula alba]|eukprot:XP_009492180.1 hypothetical protein H696_00075 [Fonticula alba]
MSLSNVVLSALFSIVTSVAVCYLFIFPYLLGVNTFPSPGRLLRFLFSSSRSPAGGASDGSPGRGEGPDDLELGACDPGSPADLSPLHCTLAGAGAGDAGDLLIGGPAGLPGGLASGWWTATVSFPLWSILSIGGLILGLLWLSVTVTRFLMRRIYSKTSRARQARAAAHQAPVGSDGLLYPGDGGAYAGNKVPQELATFLKSIQVLGYVDDAIVLELVKHTSTKKLRKGDLLLRAGELDSAMFVVTSGRIHIHIVDGGTADSSPEDGLSEETVINEVAAGGSIVSLYSVLAVLTGQYPPTLPVTAIAEEDTEVLRLPLEALASLRENHKRAVRHMLQVIVTRFQRVTVLTVNNYFGLSGELATIERRMSELSVRMSQDARALLGADLSRGAMPDLASEPSSPGHTHGSNGGVHGGSGGSGSGSGSGSSRSSTSTSLSSPPASGDAPSSATSASELQAAATAIAGVLGLEALVSRSPHSPRLSVTDELEIVTAQPGDRLTAAGSLRLGLYYVIEGHLRVYMYEPSGGRRRLVNTAGPGRLAGFLPILTSFPSFLEIEAASEPDGSGPNKGTLNSTASSGAHSAEGATSASSRPVRVAFFSRESFEALMDMRNSNAWTAIARHILHGVTPLVRQIDFGLEWLHVEAGQVLYHEGEDPFAPCGLGGSISGLGERSPEGSSPGSSSPGPGLGGDLRVPFNAGVLSAAAAFSSAASLHRARHGGPMTRDASPSPSVASEKSPSAASPGGGSTAGEAEGLGSDRSFSRAPNSPTSFSDKSLFNLSYFASSRESLGHTVGSPSGGDFHPGDPAAGPAASSGTGTDCRDRGGVYVVLHGRLRSLQRNAMDELIVNAEFGQGDAVGDIELLTASAYTSTVHAVRDSELARVPRKLFDALIRHVPQVTIHISRVIASKSKEAWLNSLSADATPKVIASRSRMKNVKTIAVIPSNRDVPIDQFIDQFSAALSNIGATLVLDSTSVLRALKSNAFERVGHLRLLSWLEEQEAKHTTILFKVDQWQSPWMTLSARQADLILVVAQGSNAHGDMTDINPAPGIFERVLETRLKPRARRELVLLHPDRSIQSGSTAPFLDARPWIQFHHHILLCPRKVLYSTTRLSSVSSTDDDPSFPIGSPKMSPLAPIARAAKKTFSSLMHKTMSPLSLSTSALLAAQARDFARLARHVTGTSVGLSLGGGGARGLAHLGVLRALERDNIPVDFVSGSSMGAFIGSLYASNLNLVESLALTRKFCSRMASVWYQLADLTYPFASWFSGRQFNRAIQKVLGEKHEIEDLWLPYFCVATNITKSRMEICQRGSVWRFVRASMSLSGYMPPICDTNGDMLLDGGYLNNLPADVMLNQFGIKRVIAVDVGADDDTKPMDYGDSLNGWWPLLYWLVGWEYRAPSLADIQSKLAYVQCVTQLERVKRMPGCFYLRPPVTTFRTLDFDKVQLIVKAGRDYGLEIVERWRSEGHFAEFLSEPSGHVHPALHTSRAGSATILSGGRPGPESFPNSPSELGTPQAHASIAHQARGRANEGPLSAAGRASRPDLTPGHSNASSLSLDFSRPPGGPRRPAAGTPDPLPGTGRLRAGVLPFANRRVSVSGSHADMSPSSGAKGPRGLVASPGSPMATLAATGGLFVGRTHVSLPPSPRFDQRDAPASGAARDGSPASEGVTPSSGTPPAFGASGQLVVHGSSEKGHPAGSLADGDTPRDLEDGLGMGHETSDHAGSSDAHGPCAASPTESPGGASAATESVAADLAAMPAVHADDPPGDIATDEDGTQTAQGDDLTASSPGPEQDIRGAEPATGEAAEEESVEAALREAAADAGLAAPIATEPPAADLAGDSTVDAPAGGDAPAPAEDADISIDYDFASGQDNSATIMAHYGGRPQMMHRRNSL